MKKPKKPKIIKYPKKPKQSASITAWENYDKRCSDVKKKNRLREAEYKRKVAKIESDKKKKAAIIRKYS